MCVGDGGGVVKAARICKKERIIAEIFLQFSTMY